MAELGVSAGTLTNWSKRKEWIDLQNEFQEKLREQMLTEIEVQNLIPAPHS